MIKNTFFKYFFYFLLFITVLVGLNVSVRRATYEAANKDVAMALSFKELKELSLNAGMDIDDFFEKLAKDTQVSRIIIEEATLSDFVESGKMTLLKGSDVMNMMRVGYMNRTVLNRLYNSVRINPDHFYLLIDEAQDFDQIQNFLSLEFGSEQVKQIRSYRILSVVDDLDDLLSIGLGFLPESLALIEKHGFTPIYSLRNSKRLNEKLVKQKLSEFSGIQPGSSIIFEGATVLGFPGYLDLVVDRLNDKKIQLGDIEFYKKKGFSALSKALPELVYRVHDIPFEVVQKSDKQYIIDRYVRAAKERSNRVLFVHPFLSVNDSNVPVLDYNISYLQQLASKLENNDLTLSMVQQYPQLRYDAVQPLELLFFSFVVMSTILLFFNFFKSFSVLFFSMYYVLASLLFYAVYAFGGYFLFVKLMAFLSAVSFPSLAIITQFPQKATEESGLIKVFHCFIYLLKVLGISLIGALLVLVFLSDLTFLKGIHQFFGVKLSFIIPLLFVGLFFYLRPHRITSIYYVLRRLYYAPVRTAGLISIFSLIIFVLILIIRSGNYTLLPIYNLEIKMRELVEGLFYVRPRTKEFLIGYPFLVISYMFVDTKISRLWIWFFNIMGSVALLSVVNSFCHLHTSLEVSLYRTLTGFLLGIVFSCVYIFLIKLLSRFSYKRLL